ncbi:calmodulin-related [Lithospermum erythrorhizon]|uniref:Calmodulin-related n=1 Tax=Lithospermum erythrorhizon TaxID=34254 RepID=A0AAV3RIV2_LITER
METINETGLAPEFITPSLSMKKGVISSASFKLRSPSLNSVRLRKIFDIFDRNNDSLITIDELSRALNLLGLEIEQSELDQFVKSYIKPGNSGLRFEDFEALHLSLNDALFGLDDDVTSDNLNLTIIDHEADALQDESDLNEAFKVFDEDGDGYISATELQVVLAKLGLQEEGKEIQRVQMMISSVDRNHDGRVDFFEFKDMMRSVLVRSA